MKLLVKKPKPSEVIPVSALVSVFSSSFLELVQVFSSRKSRASRMAYNTVKARAVRGEDTVNTAYSHIFYYQMFCTTLLILLEQYSNFSSLRPSLEYSM